ncbi:AUGMIN subunit 1-like [Miscanthus floridulus]|uniref:AUGMIN subunit 1-like n=1 Tax=Miscanthus floridulus TaxID=154761 RepID=UPI00345B220C
MAEAASLAIASLVTHSLNINYCNYLSDCEQLVHFLNMADLSNPPDWRIKPFSQIFSNHSTTSFVVASADLSLRRAEVEEKRDKVHKESKALLDYMRKAINKITELKKMLEKFKNDVEKQQVEQMTDWQTKLVMMDSKERQYILKVSNYKLEQVLGRATCTGETPHTGCPGAVGRSGPTTGAGGVRGQAADREGGVEASRWAAAAGPMEVACV